MHEAFAAYENIRHRLPPTSSKGACVRLPNLDAIANKFDTFFLDAFGVLNIGETAIAGVPERVANLQKVGKRVLVVSNAAGFPHAKLMESTNISATISTQKMSLPVARLSCMG